MDRMFSLTSSLCDHIKKILNNEITSNTNNGYQFDGVVYQFNILIKDLHMKSFVKINKEEVEEYVNGNDKSKYKVLSNLMKFLYEKVNKIKIDSFSLC